MKISGASKALTSDNFELEIVFTGTGGTITTLNNLAATLDNSGEFFQVSGNFNAAGVISGNVGFVDNNNGVLSGLIGAKGAVAVFKGKNNSGGFAGGFAVANPVYVSSNTVDYADFKTHYAEETGNTQLLALADSSGSSTTRGFLQGTPTGLIDTGITVDAGVVSDFSSQAIRLGKAQDGADGFAVLASRQGRYAGLLSETDLGAPLPIEAAATVEWTGSLHYANSSTNNRALSESPDALVLTVDVNDGTLTSNRVRVPLGQASSATPRMIEINGTFGNHADGLPVGVLGGIISLYNGAAKEKDGDLVGLIGAEGVLGVFHTSGFIGGFQASGVLPSGKKPIVVASGNADFVAWQKAFNAGNAGAVANANNLVLPVDHDATSFVTNTTYFIEGTETGHGLTNSGIGGNFLARNVLRLDSDTESGVLFYEGSIGGSGSVGIAGLLSTTDLGLPLNTEVTNAVWTGDIHALIDGSLFTDTLNLTVSFNAGTKAGEVSASITNLGGNSGANFDFDGDFDDKGVMWGDIDVDSGYGGPVVMDRGSFIGLIGQDGAVGAFKHNSYDGGDLDARFVGGFVVKP